jgi:hypothetical protein
VSHPLILEPGRVVGLTGPPGSGLTRLGLSLLAGATRRGPVAFLDVRGWLCPVAAWESGISPERLVVVRCDDRRRWSQVAAALSEGVPAVYAEVPSGVQEPLLRRLGALVRSRRTVLLLRPLDGRLPSGLTHLRVAAEDVSWEGAGDGHGRLLHRRMVLSVSGRGVGGTTAIYEVEDDGAHPVRVVPRLAPPARTVQAG